MISIIYSPMQKNTHNVAKYINHIFIRISITEDDEIHY